MMLTKRSILFIIIGGLVSAGLFWAAPSHAQGTVTYEDIQSQGIIFAGICETPPGESDTCPCRTTGTCTLDDVLQVFVNIATFILGISGSVVLLMFVYGGIVWITAGGNENRVKLGKDILVGTIIGLAIIFGAYIAITLVVSAFKTGELPAEDATIEDVAS